MRNVRSHVMYRHRDQRGPSPSDKGKSREGSRTPAVTRTNSLGTSENYDFLAPPEIEMEPYGGLSDAEGYEYSPEPPSTHPMRSLAARIISVRAIGIGQSPRLYLFGIHRSSFVYV